jgi:glyoxylase-like metal-dependent hydrolase (beta-lactamase superfamily II)
MPAEKTRYAWKLLRAGPLRLDGGSMFGVVPRAIWNRNVPCDEQGRIELAHNCLLLQREPSGSAAGSPLRVVIEVGSGDKFDEKNRCIYGLGDRCIIDTLRDAGCRCEDVDQVIVTHLHFDHAGGLTRCTARDGVDRTFPNATVHVQRREWEDALANRSVMTRTYLRENLEPIRPQLRLIDSPTPFPAGHLPQRDELPQVPLPQRETEVLPSIHVFNVPGHTWGQQAVRFTDDRGRTVVFTPDIIPTAAHVGAAYNMAYDVEPFISTVTRRWFLKEAAERDWLLVLVHEAGEPRRRVRPDGNGWYELLPAKD